MHCALLLLLVLCLSVRASGEDDLSRCPPGLNPHYLRTFRQRCYYFAVYEERYWHDANLVCEHMGGRMVSIPDSQTQQFLVQALGSLHYDHNGIWIGLTDYVEEGQWKWVSGEPLTFTNWIAGQPGIAASLEDCALMERKQGYKWGDYHCHIWPQHYSFICQFDMRPTPAPTPARVPISLTSLLTSTGPAASSRTTALPLHPSAPGSVHSTAGETTAGLHPTPAPALTTSKEVVETTVKSQQQATTSFPFMVPPGCEGFSCDLPCGEPGFQEGSDGCPVCRCVITPVPELQ